ncbi:hypothetical protein [Agrobacterium cavarae]|uniref:hypothetical protein n=1 Tax=Agrobacterium cavarae TaxID=2528239 RepID=UPI003D018499
MTTYHHINELRAELAASIDQAERQQIAAELASAEAKLAEEDAAFEALISDEPPRSCPRGWCSFGGRRAFRTEPGMDQLAAGRLMSGSSLIVAIVSSVM